jgi:Icc protein
MAQLEYLRNDRRERGAWKKARHRVVLLHHHVVPLPHGVGKSAPTEFGMRLDDATNRRRGAGRGRHDAGDARAPSRERRAPAGRDRTSASLASPSLTLGCRSGDVPSFWRVELGEHAHATRVRIPVAAVEQEADPGTEEEAPPLVSS